MALIHTDGAGKPEGVIIILTQKWLMGGSNKAESAAMWNTVKGRAEKFRARHRTGTVVLAGDLNAAKWPALDTDKQEADMWDRENDAALITWIEGNLKQLRSTAHSGRCTCGNERTRETRKAKRRWPTQNAEQTRSG